MSIAADSEWKSINKITTVISTEITSTLNLKMETGFTGPVNSFDQILAIQFSYAESFSAKTEK